MNAQQRIEAQILELHLLVAAEIERRPDEVMAYGQSILTHWRNINGDSQYRRIWQDLLDAGPDAVIAVIRDTSERGTLLRSVSPIGGFLPKERDEIFFRRPSLDDVEQDVLDELRVETVRAVIAEFDADPPGGEVSLEQMRAEFALWVQEVKSQRGLERRIPTTTPGAERRLDNPLVLTIPKKLVADTLLWLSEHKNIKFEKTAEGALIITLPSGSAATDNTRPMAD